MTDVEDEEDDVLPATKWSWARIVGCAVYAVGQVFGAVAELCSSIDDAVAGHLAYKAERTEFATNVLSDIDKIAAGRLSE